MAAGADGQALWPHSIAIVGVTPSDFRGVDSLPSNFIDATRLALAPRLTPRASMSDRSTGRRVALGRHQLINRSFLASRSANDHISCNSA